MNWERQNEIEEEAKQRCGFRGSLVSPRSQGGLWTSVVSQGYSTFVICWTVAQGDVYGKLTRWVVQVIIDPHHPFSTILSRFPLLWPSTSVVHDGLPSRVTQVFILGRSEPLVSRPLSSYGCPLVYLQLKLSMVIWRGTQLLILTFPYHVATPLPLHDNQGQLCLYLANPFYSCWSAGTRSPEWLGRNNSSKFSDTVNASLMETSSLCEPGPL